MLALMPAIGSVLGAMTAEWKQPPNWLTGASLHMAAGIATAVVAVELMPRAVETATTWMLAISFMLGAAGSIGLKQGSEQLQSWFGSGKSSGVWAVYGAVAADLFNDGLTTGAGAAVSRDLGLLLGASQIIANLPGGFAVTARFRSSGAPRSKRLWIAFLYPAPALIGAGAGYFALRGASDGVMGLALGFFSGLLLLATIEDLIPQADEPGAPRKISSFAFAGGFVLLMLISIYFGA